MGVRVKDLTGKRFGRLVAVKATKQRKNTSVVWECKCDCGNTSFVTSNHLLSGNTKSCGCLQKECVANVNTNNLTGMRFGKLTVVKASDMRKHEKVVWECVCDCGKTVYITSSNLVRGSTNSCGCLHKERVAEANLKNLVGQRFGSVVVIAPTEQRYRRYMVWECRCDCGKINYIPSSILKRLGAKLCDCKTSAKL